MFEKLMLKLGWVPVGTMTDAVNAVAADAAVDRLAVESKRVEAEKLLDVERGLRTGDIRVVGALMDELAEAKS